jgi:hypothetical protein
MITNKYLPRCNLLQNDVCVQKFETWVETPRKTNKQNDVKFNNQIWLPKDCSPYKELEMHSIFNKCNGIHNKQVLVRKLKEIVVYRSLESNLKPSNHKFFEEKLMFQIFVFSRLACRRKRTKFVNNQPT